MASLEACLEAATQAGLTVVEASSPPKAREGAEVVATMVVASSVAVARAAAAVVVWTALATEVEGWVEVRAEAAWEGVGWVAAETAAPVVVVAMEGGAKGEGATGKVAKEEETAAGVTVGGVTGVGVTGVGVMGAAGRVAGRALVESPPRSGSPSGQPRWSLGSRAPPTCRHSTVWP